MYPKTPGCFSDLSAALYYKSYCFFLKLLIVLPVHFPLLHFTPPKVLRFYYNLTFRCVRYFGGSAVRSYNNFAVLYIVGSTDSKKLKSFPIRNSSLTRLRHSSLVCLFNHVS